MDFVICNGLGIYLGMKTLKYLNMRQYHWRGMWSYPTYTLVSLAGHVELPYIHVSITGGACGATLHTR